MLKYLWEARFEDGHVIQQPEDDKYSKHNDSLPQNPSAFRDILDYQKKSPLSLFALIRQEDNSVSAVSLKSGMFYINNTAFRLEQHPLNNRKLIYYRTQVGDLQTGESQTITFNFGYEGTNGTKVEKKVITINV